MKNSIKAFLMVFCITVMSCKAQQEEKKDLDLTNHTGLVSQSLLRQGDSKDWFDKGYDVYEVREDVLKQIKKNIKKYKIKVFLGTWCPDSRRETPKFLKLLDEVNFNKKNLEIYLMNRKKETEKNYEEGLDVKHVPTFIFFDKKGNEVNRFVEFPNESLEEDILKIVTGQPYKNPYDLEDN